MIERNHWEFMTSSEQESEFFKIQDKLKRRNTQIADLKARLKELKHWDIRTRKPQDFINEYNKLNK